LRIKEQETRLTLQEHDDDDDDDDDANDYDDDEQFFDSWVGPHFVTGIRPVNSRVRQAGVTRASAPCCN